MEAVIISIE